VTIARSLPLLMVLALSGAASTAAAHGVVHTVARDLAVTVTVTHTDGSPMAHAEAVVHAPGRPRPFLLGRTDALGRLVFLPDVPGDWRVAVHTDDGHGLDTVVSIEDGDLVAADPSNGPGRTLRGVAGLVAIAAITILLMRTLGRKRS